jgi:hypothetical protein
MKPRAHEATRGSPRAIDRVDAKAAPHAMRMVQVIS